MTGIIRAPRPKKDYFDLRNATARDVRLSYRARGILIRLLSNEDGYRMTSVDLAGGGKEGRGAVLTALRELRVAGYMRTTRIQNARGQWITATYIYDIPQPVNPTEVQKPDSGFLDAGVPDVGSPAAIKNNQKNDKQKKQQHAQQPADAASAPRSGKKRRVRPSGIVTWTADDVQEAAELEASTPPEELTTAVARLRVKNKQPVPGLVAREVEVARADAAARVQGEQSALRVQAENVRAAIKNLEMLAAAAPDENAAGALREQAARLRAQLPERRAAP